LLKCEKPSREESAHGGSGRANTSEQEERCDMHTRRDESEDASCRWRVRHAACASLAAHRLDRDEQRRGPPRPLEF
jgi:hypothetical protein